MKKVFALLLTAILVLALAACAGGGSGSGDSADPGSAEEQTAQFTARINTEGMGQIAYAEEGEELEFNDEYPAQSAYLGEPEAKTYTVGAKADEGWKFVKWTKKGEDYSTEETITIEVNETDAEYIAVFDAE